jgi:hypothetical protein
MTVASPRRHRKHTRQRGNSRQKRELFAYDGVAFIGRIFENGRRVRAFNAADRSLGKFPSILAAFRAISDAHLMEIRSGTEGRQQEIAA